MKLKNLIAGLRIFEKSDDLLIIRNEQTKRNTERWEGLK